MPNEAPPTSLAMKDVIEAAGLADRGYLKDFADKPLDKDVATALLKKLDGAETLIGKKIGIPGPDAKPAEVEKFYAGLGMEAPDKYDIKGLGDKPDEAFAKEFREAAHEGRLTQWQMDKFLSKLGPAVSSRQKAVAEAQAKRDMEFEAMVKEATGPDYEKKLNRTQTALKELAPEAFKKFGDKLDDKSLVLLVATVDAVLSKYTKEDDFGGGGNGGSSSQGGADKEALTQEMHKLLGSDGWKDFRHADHEKTKQRFDEITAALAKL